MAWYPAINNSTIGIIGMFNFVQQGMAAQSSFIGSNVYALLFLMPAWIIFFFGLTKTTGNPMGSFVVASFICWIFTIYLMAVSWVNWLAFGIFLTMWLGGTIVYYLQTRH